MHCRALTFVAPFAVAAAGATVTTSAMLAAHGIAFPRADWSTPNLLTTSGDTGASDGRRPDFEGVQ